MEQDSGEHTNKGWLRQVVGDVLATLYLRSEVATRRLIQRRRRSAPKESRTSSDRGYPVPDVELAGGSEGNGKTLIQDRGDVPGDKLEGDGKVGEGVDGDVVKIADGYAVDLFGDVVPFTSEVGDGEAEVVEEIISPDQSSLFDDTGGLPDADGRDSDFAPESGGDSDASVDTESVAHSGGDDVEWDVRASADLASDDMEPAGGSDQSVEDEWAGVSEEQAPRIVTHRGSMGQLVRDDDKPPQQPGRRIRTHEYYPRDKPIERRVKLECQMAGNRWSLYLAIPEGRKVSRVVQDDAELPVKSGSVTLKSFMGLVVVNYEDGDAEIIPTFDAVEESDGIVFKTGREWESGWRHVRRPGNGYAIVFALRDRDSAWGSGIVEHGREECVDERFQAYFLELTGVGSPNNTDRIILDGRTIYDGADVDHYGKLYVGGTPEMIVGDDVTVARVVRETGDMDLNKRSFRKDFYPHIASLSSVLDGREGWFGIRVYVDGVLGDSPPFRLCGRLARILMDGQEYAEGVSLFMAGEDVPLRFESEDGDALIPDISPVQFDSDGIAKLGVDMDDESLEFRFRNTPVFIEVPRLRWRFVDEEGHAGEWGNDILRFDAGAFRDLIDARIEISAPGFVDEVKVGFSFDDVSYASGGAAGRWSVSLPHFSDYRAVADMGGEDLSLMIFAKGQSAAIARIVAERGEVSGVADAAVDDVGHVEDSRVAEMHDKPEWRDLIRFHIFCQNQRAFDGAVDKGKGRLYYSREERIYRIGRRED